MEGAGCYLACHMGVKDMNELSSLKKQVYMVVGVEDKIDSLVIWIRKRTSEN